GGEPMTNSPAGMATISGQPEQSAKDFASLCDVPNPGIRSRRPAAKVARARTAKTTMAILVRMDPLENEPLLPIHGFHPGKYHLAFSRAAHRPPRPLRSDQGLAVRSRNRGARVPRNDDGHGFAPQKSAWTGKGRVAILPLVRPRRAGEWSHCPGIALSR